MCGDAHWAFSVLMGLSKYTVVASDDPWDRNCVSHRYVEVLQEVL